MYFIITYHIISYHIISFHITYIYIISIKYDLYNGCFQSRIRINIFTGNWNVSFWCQLQNEGCWRILTDFGTLDITPITKCCFWFRMFVSQLASPAWACVAICFTRFWWSRVDIFWGTSLIFSKRSWSRCKALWKKVHWASTTSKRCFSTVKQIACSLCWACSWATFRVDGSMLRHKSVGRASKMNLISSSRLAPLEKSCNHFSASSGGSLVWRWGYSCENKQQRFLRDLRFSSLSRYFFLDCAATIAVSMLNETWIRLKRMPCPKSSIGNFQFTGKKVSFSKGCSSQEGEGGKPWGCTSQEKKPIWCNGFTERSHWEGQIMGTSLHHSESWITCTFKPVFDSLFSPVI